MARYKLNSKTIEIIANWLNCILANDQNLNFVILSTNAKRDSEKPNDCLYMNISMFDILSEQETVDKIKKEERIRTNSSTYTVGEFDKPLD